MNIICRSWFSSHLFIRPSTVARMPIIHTVVYVSVANVCWFLSRSALASISVSHMLYQFVTHSCCLLTILTILTNWSSPDEIGSHSHTATHTRTPNVKWTGPNQVTKKKGKKNLPKAFKNDLKFNYSAFCTAVATVCTTNFNCHTRNSHRCQQMLPRIGLHIISVTHPSNRIRTQSFSMP